MAGVEIRIEEADRHRFDLMSAERRGQPLDLVHSERCPDAAGTVDALGHFQSQFARNQRRIAVKAQVERLRAVAAANLQDIAKSPRGQQRGLGARALQQRIDDERGAVLDRGRLARIETGLADAIEDRLIQMTVSRGTLGVGDCASLNIAGNKIGEGATDIDGDEVGHAAVPFQLILMPALWMTSAHSGMRRSSILVMSFGAPMRGKTPAARSLSCTPPSSSACSTSA